MQISYQLSKTDVLEGQRKHLGFWVRLLPIFGILLLVASFASLIHDPKQFPSAVGELVAGLFLTLFLRLQVWFSFRRDNRLQEQFEASISDLGIDVSSSTGATKYNWSAFVRYVETKNLFMVYQAPQVFNIFPKRAVTAEDVDSFRTLLDQRLGTASIAFRKRISPKTWAFLLVVGVAAVLLAMAIKNTR